MQHVVKKAIQPPGCSGEKGRMWFILRNVPRARRSTAACRRRPRAEDVVRMMRA